VKTHPLAGASFLVLCGILSSCGGTSAAAGIKPTSSSQAARKNINDLLTARGFVCKVEEDDVQCEADRTYKVLMEYRHAPPRLFLFAWFDTNGKGCSQLDAQVLAYNKAYPTQVSCIDEEQSSSLRFFASTLVPESGITARELEEYLTFWSGFIHDSAYEAGLFDKDASKTPDKQPAAAPAVPVTPS